MMAIALSIVAGRVGGCRIWTISQWAMLSPFRMMSNPCLLLGTGAGFFLVGMPFSLSFGMVNRHAEGRHGDVSMIRGLAFAFIMG